MTNQDIAWSVFYRLTRGLKEPQSVYSCTRRTLPSLVIKKGIREPDSDETPLSKVEQDFALTNCLLVSLHD